MMLKKIIAEKLIAKHCPILKIENSQIQAEQHSKNLIFYVKKDALQDALIDL